VEQEGRSRGVHWLPEINTRCCSESTCDSRHVVTLFYISVIDAVSCGAHCARLAMGAKHQQGVSS